jgi:diguanylate cyclase (GGDEF)-like protein
VARYGGEEFAVILPEIPKTDAIIVAERLRKTIDAMQIEHENQPIPVSLSFGLSFFEPDKNIGKIELIKEADSPLYQAKRAGRNICKCFDTQKTNI